jgi:N-acyl-D-aspartate/D-glutamate deacylase
VYDGTGGPAVRADVGISGDRIARISPSGPEGPKAAGLVIDAAGRAVCPGFINILSHSS